MAAVDQDTDRVAVKTYVPAYQRDEWDDHADRLDMSRSEFVRSMVQAGRRGFDPGGSADETGSDDDTERTPERDGSMADDSVEPSPPSENFDDLVLDLLDGECLSWPELVDELTEDVEERLDESVRRLQSANEIEHSGRRGGYVRTE